jgi:hypothetical protein
VALFNQEIAFLEERARRIHDIEMAVDRTHGDDEESPLHLMPDITMEERKRARLNQNVDANESKQRKN